jgi:hypothetical protein
MSVAVCPGAHRPEAATCSRARRWHSRRLQGTVRDPWHVPPQPPPWPWAMCDGVAVGLHAREVVRIAVDAGAPIHKGFAMAEVRPGPRDLHVHPKGIRASYLGRRAGPRGSTRPGSSRREASLPRRHNRGVPEEGLEPPTRGLILQVFGSRAPFAGPGGHERDTIRHPCVTSPPGELLDGSVRRG